MASRDSDQGCVYPVRESRLDGPKSAVALLILSSGRQFSAHTDGGGEDVTDGGAASAGQDETDGPTSLEVGDGGDGCPFTSDSKPCNTKLYGTEKDRDLMTGLLQRRAIVVKDTCYDKPVETVKERLDALFRENVFGFVVYFSGHGGGEGSWAFFNGSLTFNDMLSLWRGRDTSNHGIDKSQQCLLIIADCCAAGKWAEQLLAHHLGSGAYEEFGRVYVQAGCKSFQRSCDSAMGSMFTLAYTRYASEQFHDGAITCHHLTDTDQREETRIVHKCDGQQPCTINCRQDKLTGCVRIGKGLGLTNAWMPILTERKKTNATSDRRPPARTERQISVGAAADDIPEDVLLDLVKNFSNKFDVKKLAGYSDISTDFAERALEECSKITEAAFQVLKEIMMKKDNPGQTICDALKKMEKMKVLRDFKKKLLPSK